MTDRGSRDSILSHGEQDVAGYLRRDPPPSAEEIARSRDAPEETVAQSIDRIRTKTRRAFATLVQSPFTEEIAADMDQDCREELITALRRADEDPAGDAE